MPPFSTALKLAHDHLGTMAITASVLALGGACWLVFRPRPNAAELERRRRAFLAKAGRITDATLVDPSLADGAMGGHPNWTDWNVHGGAEGEDMAPTVLIYHYRVSGVTYESAQDVSLLADYVRHVRVDLPAQVRYDPHNPTNSIVVSEEWSGLRLGPDSVG